MQCRAPKASYLKVALAAFATDPRIAAFRARFASTMGLTHRRIDPIDADRFASRSCFFPRASDALDMSARRGVRVALEASHPLLSTRTIRRPGGRAEDAIAEGHPP